MSDQEKKVHFPVPEHSKSQVNKAGKILATGGPRHPDREWALGVVNNWRACHGYPINTFQATLRKKLRRVDPDAIVAQRLKRLPTIAEKLRRESNMKLTTMQDIGGLRAINSDISKTLALHDDYVSGHYRFKHELYKEYNYIENPKPSGYRSIHMTYSYSNAYNPAYDGLRIELQMRSRVQHAWATAVETLGFFVREALKSSKGSPKWLRFFKLAGAAFAVLEDSPVVPGFEGMSEKEIFGQLIKEADRLRIIDELTALAVVADDIVTTNKKGMYSLIYLDLDNRRVSVQHFTQDRLDEANDAYTKLETGIAKGGHDQAVLVSAGDIHRLKRAYPNFFLDAHMFAGYVEEIRALV